MKLASALACALASVALFASETSAAQRRAIFEGVVIFASSSQPGGFSMDQLAVGDSFKVEVGLPSSGVPVGTVLNLYPVGPYVGGLLGGLASITVSNTTDPGLLATSNDDSLGFDRLSYQQFLSSGDNCTLQIDDPTAALFSSQGALDQPGTVLIPAAADAQVFVEAAIGTPLVTGNLISITVLDDDSIGIAFCEGWVNSTGVGGVLQAFGSARLSLNSFQLEATQLPPGAAAFTISSMTQNFAPPATGVPFRLCLGGPVISRHLSTLGIAGAAGRLAMPIDLEDFPMGPFNSGPVLPGQTWHFQTWYRDLPPHGSTGPTSNGTIGVSVTFE